MKLTPCSRARAMMRPLVASTVAPPNIIVPRQSGDTLSPLRPRLRYSTAPPLGFVQLIELLQSLDQRGHFANRDHVRPVARRAIGIWMRLNEHRGDSHGESGTSEHGGKLALA